MLRPISILAAMTATLLIGCDSAPNNLSKTTLDTDPLTRANEYFVYEQSLAFLQHYRAQTENLFNASLGDCNPQAVINAAKRTAFAKLMGLAATEADDAHLAQLIALAESDQSNVECAQANELATALSEMAEADEQQWREIEGPRLLASATEATLYAEMKAGSERIHEFYKAYTQQSELIRSARIVSTQALLEYLDTEQPESLGSLLTDEALHKDLREQIQIAISAFENNDEEAAYSALTTIENLLQPLTTAGL